MKTGLVERYLLTAIMGAALASGVGHYSAKVGGTTLGQVAIAIEVATNNRSVQSEVAEIPAFPYVVPGDQR